MGVIMGRKERRLQERNNRIESKKEKILLSNENIIEMKRNVRKQTSDYATNVLLNCFALSLNEVYGFGRKRIHRMLKHVEHNLCEIANNNLTVVDCEQMVFEKTGMRISKR